MEILLGYNGSEEAKAALEVAKRHAKTFPARKVHVVISLEGGEREELAQVESAERHLQDAEQVLGAAGVVCETHQLVHGVSPGEDLVAFAREKGVDEIIIGLRHRSKVGKLVFGSNAQFVILEAPCPVVTVKP